LTRRPRRCSIARRASANHAYSPTAAPATYRIQDNASHLRVDEQKDYWRRMPASVATKPQRPGLPVYARPAASLRPTTRDWLSPQPRKGSVAVTPVTTASLCWPRGASWWPRAVVPVSESRRGLAGSGWRRRGSLAAAFFLRTEGTRARMGERDQGPAGSVAPAPPFAGGTLSRGAPDHAKQRPQAPLAGSAGGGFLYRSWSDRGTAMLPRRPRDSCNAEFDRDDEVERGPSVFLHAGRSPRTVVHGLRRRSASANSRI
jgi:hypothetical protein